MKKEEEFLLPLFDSFPFMNTLDITQPNLNLPLEIWKGLFIVVLFFFLRGA